MSDTPTFDSVTETAPEQITSALIEEATSNPVALDHSTTGAPLTEQTDDLVAVPVVTDAATFTELGVRPETVEALAAVGITRAFAIQELTLPIALTGHDVIGQARTGTGKTLGFGIPILQRVLGPREGADGIPQALVVVPTRELCVQVTRDIVIAGKRRGVRVLSVYGGRAYEPQTSALKAGVDIVIGTPGRLLDLAEQKHLRLGAIRMLVLDEADEMLDLGFLPDIERVLAMVPDERQTMLFSATMPSPIVTLARRFMHQPVHVRAEQHDESQIVPSTRQLVYRAHALDKAELLSRVLQAADRGLTMVFCRTKRTAQNVADELADRGFSAAAVHGDLAQGAREQALRAFRAGKIDVLVATDVAARGIDVTGVTHVVNYQCPEDEKVYLHRIGRTGRAGASGVAVTLVDWDELTRWSSIDAALDLGLGAPEETYSTSPHLYADLGVPENVAGTLPRNQRTRAGLAAEQIEDIGETGRGKRSRTTDDRVRSRRTTRTGSKDDGSLDTPDLGGGGPDEAPRRQRTARARRRTRSGMLVKETSADQPKSQESDAPDVRPAGIARTGVHTADVHPAGDVAPAAAATDTDTDTDTDTASVTPTRRRRRRGGRGRSATDETTPSDQSGSAEA